jgi:hypothetical protein
MTHAEILAAVQARPELIALIPDTQAIADFLSVGRKRIIERLAGRGTAMKYIGGDAGATLVEAIRAMAETEGTPLKIKLAYELLLVNELDLGLQEVRDMLDYFAANESIVGFTQEHANILKGLAEIDAPVDEFEVRCALLNDNGTWRV